MSLLNMNHVALRMVSVVMNLPSCASLFISVCFSSLSDLGSNNSGYYDLKAVLTHKGRSSNSGHYLGWIRRPTGTHIMCSKCYLSYAFMNR